MVPGSAARAAGEFLLALLSFAVCLFLGILGLVVTAAMRGAHPNMTIAYREIAFPAALVAGAGALVMQLLWRFVIIAGRRVVVTTNHVAAVAVSIAEVLTYLS